MMTMMKNEATEFRSLNIVVLFYFFGFFDTQYDFTQYDFQSRHVHSTLNY